MFSRVIHLADRFGRLLAKATDRSSHNASLTIVALLQRVGRRTLQPSLTAQTAKAEAQVQSLSGITVLLLAAVVTLIFWATNLQDSGRGPIQILAINDVPANQGASRIASDGTEAAITAQSQQLHSSGSLTFSMTVGGQDDLFALNNGQFAPTRLTDDPADDRSPAWSPDGKYIAFASRRDGNWEIYTVDTGTGDLRRLTFDTAYENAPTWSPDGQWIAYESYIDGNLNIYLMKADGTEGPYPVTRSPAADFSPRWTTEPQGRTIAYVSLKSGNADIYLISLDDPNEERAINLTNSSALQEQNPAWSPDGGQIAYSAIENGIPLLYIRSATDLTLPPRIVGQGLFPTWSPDGNSLAYINPRSDVSSDDGDLLVISPTTDSETPSEAMALSGRVMSLSWSESVLPSPQGSLAFAATSPLPQPYQEPLIAPVEQGAQYRMINLSSIVAESPNLSDRVDGSFMKLRDDVNRAAGWDFLGRLDNVWWPLNRPVEPGQAPNNWHKAGRAFDIVQAYNQGNPPQIELVQEQIGSDTYWRLYIRAAIQDGSLGEPLRSLPWNFSARTSGDVKAYENGGRQKDDVPLGYYVDFTKMAANYGWLRTPSDPTWKYNWPGVLYWQYEKHDGLDWWNAMLELYPQEALETALFTPTPVPTNRNPTVIATPSSPTPPTGVTPRAIQTPSATRTPGSQSN